MDVPVLPLKPRETLTWAPCPGRGLRCAQRMWRDVPKEPRQSSGSIRWEKGAGWGLCWCCCSWAGAVCLPCSWELQFCARMDNQQLQTLRRSFCPPGMKCQTLCAGVSLESFPAGTVGKLIPVPRRAPSEPLSSWPLGEQPVPVLVALRQEQGSHTPKEPLSLPFMSGACAAANR